jgi:hypothetical protein
MKNLKLLLFTLLLMGLAGCEGEESGGIEIIDLPMELPINPYSACLDNVEKDKIRLINSKQALLILSCEDNILNWNIDFDKYSILLVTGTAIASPATIDNWEFTQLESNNYQLEVDIKLGYRSALDSWAILILTPQLSQNAAISLNLNQYFQ